MSQRVSFPIGSKPHRSTTDDSNEADAPAQETSSTTSQQTPAPVPVTTATTEPAVAASTPATSPPPAADAPRPAPPRAPDVAPPELARQVKKKEPKQKVAKKRNTRHRLPLYASIAACVAVIIVWGFTNGRIAIALAVLLAAIAGGLIGKRLKSPIKTAGQSINQFVWAHRPHAQLYTSLAAEEGEHFDLRQTRRAIIAVLSQKGGVGKSMVATIIAWLSAMLSHQPTLLIDARHKRGNVAERVDIKGRENPLQAEPGTTISLRQALRLFLAGFFVDADVTQTILGSVPGRKLDVIVSDKHIKPSNLFISVAHYVQMVSQLRKHYKLIVQESADELGRDFDLALLEQCDIPMFVHNVRMPNSFDELSEGLLYYTDFDPKYDRKIRDHGVLWVLATKSGQTAEQFSRMFHDIIPPERVILVPYNAFFVLKGTDPQPDGAYGTSNAETQSSHLDLTKMPLVAREAYVRGLNSGLRTLEPLRLDDNLSPDDNTADPNGQQTTGGNPK